MIINFSVSNFYSIKEEVRLSFEATRSDDLADYYFIKHGLEKDLRILKLGLIYGANASGKTTILNALDFLRQLAIFPLEKKTEKLNFQPFLFDENTPNESSTFRLDFIQEGVRYLYFVEFNQSAILNESLHFYHPNKALVYKRTTDLEHQFSSIEFGSKIKINKEAKASLEANTLWNNTVLGGFLKTNIKSQELQNASDWFKSILQPLVFGNTNLTKVVTEFIEFSRGAKDKVIDVLNNAGFSFSDITINREFTSSTSLNLSTIQDFLKSIEIIKDVDIDFESGSIRTKSDKAEEWLRSGYVGNLKIQFQHSIHENGETKTYNLPYEQESQGTQRYYQLSGLIALMLTNKLIYPIDELESSLHPDLLKHFILTFLTNTDTSQIIATTHYRELLKERDIFRNDVIWFTEKKEDGSTDLYALTDFDTSVVRDTSSVYNAYKIGKLGAVPELEDYHVN